MKPREMLLAAVAVAFAFGLPSCGVGTANSTIGVGTPPTLVVSPTPPTVPVGSIVNFTATTDASYAAVWTLDYSAIGDAGTLSYPNGANTAEYTAPPTPPIYNLGDTSTMQGKVFLYVSVSNSNLTSTGVLETFAITAPSVTAGITPAALSLGLTGSQYFSAYAVGNVNNAVTLEVNGIVGGNATVGTITTSGYYTAPAAIPMSGPKITITCVSQADPTKTASAIVTLI